MKIDINYLLMVESAGIRIAIIGASGAVGKEIVRCAKNDKRITEIALVVRRKIDEWNPENFIPKLTVIEKESFDDMSSLEEELKGFNVFLCTLGSRVGRGHDEFIKVDLTYPTEFCKLAKKLGVTYYGLLSSTGAKEKSMLLYMKTKGQVEKACREVEVPLLTIFRPGLIKERDGDKRLGEKIAGWIPFISKISGEELGRSIYEHAIAFHKGGQNAGEVPEVLLLEHGMIRSFLSSVPQGA